MKPSPEMIKQLEQFGQQHLLAAWDQISAAQQAGLLKQLEAIDLARITRLHAQGVGDSDGSERARRAGPPPAIRLDDDKCPIDPELALQEGERLLREGRVGMILVAGGQGTRLGFDQPKGMFPLGPVSQRTLFEILIDQLLARGKSAGHPIPLYLMTSPATDQETRDYFDANDRLGLAENDFRIFCQGTMPAVDESTGQLLLESPDQLALSPDGHGGLLRAFEQSGCLQDARERGVEHLFYAQIDNPLVSVCDPLLLGFHALSGSEMTTQVVRKTHALERVGNVVELDGKVQIIEYSDLPEEVARETDASGELKLWAGNIAVHVFRRDFLERAATRDESLPFHIARKKVPHWNVDAQESVDPTEPNAIKFERFIFDLLPHAENAIVVEADKSKAFAPVKNNDSESFDTPSTAKAAMIELHRSWLSSAGVEVPADTPVEIHPAFALDASELKLKRDQVPPITGPTFLK